LRDSWSKGGRRVGLTNLTAIVCLLSGNQGVSNSWNPQRIGLLSSFVFYYTACLSL